MGSRWKISVQTLDPSKTAVATGRDLRISYKNTVEVCKSIKGKKVEEAKRILEDVVSLKRPIPFKRYNKKVAHRKGLQGWSSGRWPVKVAKEMLKILNEAEANAMYKGLDTERLRVAYAITHKATKIKKYIPRAFGRSSPYFQQLVHIEIILEER